MRSTAASPQLVARLFSFGRWLGAKKGRVTAFAMTRPSQHQPLTLSHRMGQMSDLMQIVSFTGSPVPVFRVQVQNRRVVRLAW